MSKTAGRSTRGVSRTRWSAAGAALVVALGGGALAFVNADDAPSNSFVPISPCRLLDTRPSPFTVGPRNTPITAGESLTVQVTGINGNCVIPATATAIVINMTVAGPTANSFMTVYPADVSLPTASNLNFVAGQSATPNLVTVSLSSIGAIKIFNNAGTVNVIGDIAGYYQPDTGTANAGAACNVGGLPGVIVNGVDHEHNLSSKCFTRLVTTLAGSGDTTSVDGIGLDASFSTPVAVAVDEVGNMYVVDQDSALIRKVTITGVVTTFAGTTDGFADGPAETAQFSVPTGVAVDSVGNVYVADNFNNRIRKIDPLGMVTTFAGSAGAGDNDGNGAAAQFSNPAGVAVDADDNVYVADGNHSIRKITPTGDVTTLAGGDGFGFTDGPPGTAKFRGPNALAVDADGNVYVADQNNHTIRKVTPAGDVTTLAGNGSAGFANGTGAAAQFDEPWSVAVGVDGNVYVADRGNDFIRMVTPAGVVTTVAGTDSLLLLGSVDGVGSGAKFVGPAGIAIDNAGTIYVVEAGGRLRRMS